MSTKMAMRPKPSLAGLPKVPSQSSEIHTDAVSKVKDQKEKIR